MSAPAGPWTVLFLSNAPSRGNMPHVPGEGPDPYLLRDGLAARGVVLRARPLNRFPLNPFAKTGTFYAGFDLLRVLLVLLRDRRVDAVVSVGESNVAALLLLAPLLRFTPPVVLREISARGWRRRDRVVDFVLPRVDRVMVLTPHQAGWAAANCRLKAPPDLVGFAIDEAFFTPQNAPDGGYILAVGDDIGRDYPCLIEACRDTPYRLILRTSSRPAIPEAMRGRVSVLGRLPYPALRALYAAASVVAVPLRPVDHPSGITALFEGMAMGRAVVASDIGATRHAVSPGVDGLLVPPGDPAALRMALAALMDDATRRRRLGVQARRTIEARFSYAAYVDRFAASLQAAIARA